MGVMVDDLWGVVEPFHGAVVYGRHLLHGSRRVDCCEN